MQQGATAAAATAGPGSLGTKLLSLGAQREAALKSRDVNLKLTRKYADEVEEIQARVQDAKTKLQQATAELDKLKASPPLQQKLWDYFDEQDKAHGPYKLAELMDLLRGREQTKVIHAGEQQKVPMFAALSKIPNVAPVLVAVLSAATKADAVKAQLQKKVSAIHQSSLLSEAADFMIQAISAREVKWSLMPSPTASCPLYTAADLKDKMDKQVLGQGTQVYGPLGQPFLASIVVSMCESLEQQALSRTQAAKVVPPSTQELTTLLSTLEVSPDTRCWYYYTSGTKRGPFTSQEVASSVEEGTLSTFTLMHHCSSVPSLSILLRTLLDHRRSSQLLASSTTDDVGWGGQRAGGGAGQGPATGAEGKPWGAEVEARCVQHVRLALVAGIKRSVLQLLWGTSKGVAHQEGVVSQVVSRWQENNHRQRDDARKATEQAERQMKAEMDSILGFVATGSEHIAGPSQSIQPSLSVEPSHSTGPSLSPSAFAPDKSASGSHTHGHSVGPSHCAGPSQSRCALSPDNSFGGSYTHSHVLLPPRVKTEHAAPTHQAASPPRAHRDQHRPNGRQQQQQQQEQDHHHSSDQDNYEDPYSEQKQQDHHHSSDQDDYEDPYSEQQHHHPHLSQDQTQNQGVPCNRSHHHHHHHSHSYNQDDSQDHPYSQQQQQHLLQQQQQQQQQQQLQQQHKHEWDQSGHSKDQQHSQGAALEAKPSQWDASIKAKPSQRDASIEAKPIFHPLASETLPSMWDASTEAKPMSNHFLAEAKPSQWNAPLETSPPSSAAPSAQAPQPKRKAVVFKLGSSSVAKAGAPGELPAGASTAQLPIGNGGGHDPTVLRTASGSHYGSGTGEGSRGGASSASKDAAGKLPYHEPPLPSVASHSGSVFPLLAPLPPPLPQVSPNPPPLPPVSPQPPPLPIEDPAPQPRSAKPSQATGLGSSHLQSSHPRSAGSGLGPSHSRHKPSHRSAEVDEYMLDIDQFDHDDTPSSPPPLPASEPASPDPPLPPPPPIQPGMMPPLVYFPGLGGAYPPQAPHRSWPGAFLPPPSDRWGGGLGHAVPGQYMPPSLPGAVPLPCPPPGSPPPSTSRPPLPPGDPPAHRVPPPMPPPGSPPRPPLPPSSTPKPSTSSTQPPLPPSSSSKPSKSTSQPPPPSASTSTHAAPSTQPSLPASSSSKPPQFTTQPPPPSTSTSRHVAPSTQPPLPPSSPSKPPKLATQPPLPPALFSRASAPTAPHPSKQSSDVAAAASLAHHRDRAGTSEPTDQDKADTSLNKLPRDKVATNVTQDRHIASTSVPQHGDKASNSIVQDRHIASTSIPQHGGKASNSIVQDRQIASTSIPQHGGKASNRIVQDRHIASTSLPQHGDKASNSLVQDRHTVATAQPGENNPTSSQARPSPSERRPRRSKWDQPAPLPSPSQAKPSQLVPLPTTSQANPQASSSSQPPPNRHSDTHPKSSLPSQPGRHVAAAEPHASSTMQPASASMNDRATIPHFKPSSTFLSLDTSAPSSGPSHAPAKTFPPLGLGQAPSPSPLPSPSPSPSAAAQQPLTAQPPSASATEAEAERKLPTRHSMGSGSVGEKKSASEPINGVGGGSGGGGAAAPKRRFGMGLVKRTAPPPPPEPEPQPEPPAPEPEVQAPEPAATQLGSALLQGPSSHSLALTECQPRVSAGLAGGPSANEGAAAAAAAYQDSPTLPTPASPASLGGAPPPSPKPRGDKPNGVASKPPTGKPARANSVNHVVQAASSDVSDSPNPSLSASPSADLDSSQSSIGPASAPKKGGMSRLSSGPQKRKLAKSKLGAGGGGGDIPSRGGHKGQVEESHRVEPQVKTKGERKFKGQVDSTGGEESASIARVSGKNATAVGSGSKIATVVGSSGKNPRRKLDDRSIKDARNAKLKQKRLLKAGLTVGLKDRAVGDAVVPDVVPTHSIHTNPNGGFGAKGEAGGTGGTEGTKVTAGTEGLFVSEAGHLTPPSHTSAPSYLAAAPLAVAPSGLVSHSGAWGAVGRFVPEAAGVGGSTIITYTRTITTESGGAPGMEPGLAPGIAASGLATSFSGLPPGVSIRGLALDVTPGLPPGVSIPGLAPGANFGLAPGANFGLAPGANSSLALGMSASGLASGTSASGLAPRTTATDPSPSIHAYATADQLSQLEADARLAASFMEYKPLTRKRLQTDLPTGALGPPPRAPSASHAPSQTRKHLNHSVNVIRKRPKPASSASGSASCSSNQGAGSSSQAKSAPSHQAGTPSHAKSAPSNRTGSPSHQGRTSPNRYQGDQDTQARKEAKPRGRPVSKSSVGGSWVALPSGPVVSGRVMKKEAKPPGPPPGPTCARLLPYSSVAKHGPRTRSGPSHKRTASVAGLGAGGDQPPSAITLNGVGGAGSGGMGFQPASNGVIGRAEQQLQQQQQQGKRGKTAQKLLLLRSAQCDDGKASASAMADAASWQSVTSRSRLLKFGRSKIQGWGMFALETIEADEFVIQYVGEAIRITLADKREREYQAAGIDDYMFRVDETTVLDATRKGGPARFINHSCEPNCYTKHFHLEGQTKIGIYSKTRIEVGQELCYDYKFEIEEDPARKVPCFCGAQNCRDWMC